LERVVQHALASVLDMIKPGVTCAEAHWAAQRVIDAAGMTDRYRKRTGYSLAITVLTISSEEQSVLGTADAS
jgi:Xaa-Pro dipeptidase